MASSSSSHQQRQKSLAFSTFEPQGTRRKVSESSRLYDVFINHRGPDVKDTLATKIYKSLERKGLRAFLDSKEKELGDSLPSTLETAILSASVHIAIFSKRYAESAWCLAELVLMIQSQAKIIPVFYEVEPSVLRYTEKGVYAEAFSTFKEKSRYLDKLEEWKEALRDVSHITGYVCNYSLDDHKHIVSAVRKEVQRTKSLYVAKYRVGLDELAQNFESQWGLNEEGSEEAKIVGICGMGGLGKTTLSKELFNRNISKYTRASFLFDVREACARNEICSLQIKLLKDIFNEDPPNFQSVEEGTSYLKDCLERSRFLSFLIVLDGIDHVKQLDALLVMDMLNNPSLIIITTRDVGVLTSAGITNNYYLKGMNRDHATELFCCYAFGDSHPANGYEDLVDSFIDVCEGVPLSLQVLGRHVRLRPQDYWCAALKNVRKMLLEVIKQTLKISVDTLDREEKQVFLDIACFFINQSESMAVRVWEGSGWIAPLALKTLKDKCVVEEIEIDDEERRERKRDGRNGIRLRMHDHLRDLGREMADELRHPTRLWRPEHLTSLESMGFKYILDQTKGRCFHSIVDKSLACRITYFVRESDNSAERKTSLLWLQLEYLNSSLHPSISSWIPLQNLQCLRISDGHLERLWESDIQVPIQLKELQIFQTRLGEVPDLSQISNNLEKVFLDAEYMPINGWSLLGSLRMSLYSLYLKFDKLKGELASNMRGKRTTSRSLVIKNFEPGEEMAFNLDGMSNNDTSPLSRLQNLEISNQGLLTRILISGTQCPSLQSLKLDQIENLVEVILLRVEKLNCLEITRCKIFRSLRCDLHLTKLVLNISECPKLEELSLAHLSCLERITIRNCKHLRSLSGLSELRKLVLLNIRECPELQELSLAHESCLGRIKIENCENLKRVSGISYLANLIVLNISECPELQELSLAHLSCLKRIIIENCKNLKIASGISDLNKLVDLNISQCQDLKCLELNDCKNLEHITVDRCEKLKRLESNGCKNLKTVSGLEGLKELEILDIRDCFELQKLPIHNLTCWERIKIDGKLDGSAFYSLLNLKIATLDIGRAVDRAELTLNPHLFSDVIGADAVTEMDILCDAIPLELVSAIIVCCVVVVDRCTPPEDMKHRSEELHVRPGRWMVTMVIPDPKLINSFIREAVQGMCYGIVKKGCRVTVKKGEESKTFHVLQTIVGQLYEKQL